MKGSGSLSSANSDFEKAQSHSAAERKNEQTDSLYQQEKENVSAWQNLKDSFKRADDVHIADDLSGVDKVAVLTAQAPLNRSLKNRHLQMIAIGGAIGTGLFVGSGKALHDAGPAGILLGWILTSTMIMVVCLSLGELAVTFPVSGGYMTYVSRFVDESYAFGNNYNYMLQWLIVLPLEIVAAMITVYYWPVEKQYKAGFVTLFYLTIISINMFGVKGFGEAESIFSLVKVITVIGFIIMGIILAAGGGPSKEATGFKYWKDPGAFVGKNSHERFKSFSSVFVTAAFSFAGTELVGIAAAETAVPRKSVPKAAKQVFWRISIFYVASLFIVGLLVPSNDDRLLSESMVDAKASPFVLAAKNHGVHGIPAIMNVVILISVLSVGNSAVYTCSRVIASLASQGFLPDVCAYIDRKGRPLVGMAISSAAGLIAFICLSDAQSEAFDWMMAISGLSSLFTWFSICLSHIRFRLALKKRGRTIDELAYASPAGLWGSIYGALVIAMVLILQFWVAISPINTPPSAEIFFKKYISIFILFVMTGGHKLFSIIKRRKLYISLNDIDLDTGRREPDLEVFKQELLEERAILATKPLYYRIYNFWC